MFIGRPVIEKPNKDFYMYWCMCVIAFVTVRPTSAEFLSFLEDASVLNSSDGENVIVYRQANCTGSDGDCRRANGVYVR